MFIMLPDGVIVNLSQTFYIRQDSEKLHLIFVRDDVKRVSYQCKDFQEMSEIVENIKKLAKIQIL